MSTNELRTSRDKTRVLVIDDDDIAREFLANILRRAGFTVSELPSTIGVTNQIVRDEIHVVVIDIMMPTIRGDKLAQLLRRNAQLSNLGVVLVSGSPREEVDHLLREVRADAFVGKDEARTALANAVMRAARVRPSNT